MISITVTRDIKINEEITVHYGDHYKEVIGAVNLSDQDISPPMRHRCISAPIPPTLPHTGKIWKNVMGVNSFAKKGSWMDLMLSSVLDECVLVGVGGTGRSCCRVPLSQGTRGREINLAKNGGSLLKKRLGVMSYLLRMKSPFPRRQGVM